MATDYEFVRPLDVVDYFQDCQNGGEILDTIDAVFETATRWAIHNYEIQELLKDFSKGFEIVKPYHAQVVKMLNK